MPSILLIEDEENLRLSIARILTRSGHTVKAAASLLDARAAMRAHEFDVVLTDVILPGQPGSEFVRELRSEGFDGAIVVMTAHSTVESAVAAMRDGADDYLQKPLALEDLPHKVSQWFHRRTLERRVRLYERLEQTTSGDHSLLGESPRWRETLALADRLARLPLHPPGAPGAGGGPAPLPAILIQGETGAGKGVLARHIHDRSSDHVRPRPPFVHVNCSALPAQLVESELFGHEKGAFTDAREARQGLFEMADGGTIFLDEIGDMPLELQAKLLLVVESGSFRRVGGTKERTVRARVIAASNQSLADRIDDGAFRRDLYYRLSAFTIKIPPLRDRADDALLIAQELVRRAGPGVKRLGSAASAAIAAHPWPGNVRELVNSVQRALALADADELTPDDLGLAQPAEPDPIPVTPLPAPDPSLVSQQPQAAPTLMFDFDNGVHTAEDVERTLIVQALQRTRGNVSAAARLIGMQRSSLRHRIDRFALHAYVREISAS